MYTIALTWFTYAAYLNAFIWTTVKYTTFSLIKQYKVCQKNIRTLLTLLLLTFSYGLVCCIHPETSESKYECEHKDRRVKTDSKREEVKTDVAEEKEGERNRIT